MNTEVCNMPIAHLVGVIENSGEIKDDSLIFELETTTLKAKGSLDGFQLITLGWTSSDESSINVIVCDQESIAAELVFRQSHERERRSILIEHVMDQAETTALLKGNATAPAKRIAKAEVIKIGYGVSFWLLSERDYHLWARAWNCLIDLENCSNKRSQLTHQVWSIFDKQPTATQSLEFFLCQEKAQQAATKILDICTKTLDASRTTL